MPDDDEQSLRRIAVDKTGGLRKNETSFPIDNDYFEGRFIGPTSTTAESTVVRKFSIPKFNFRAKSCHKMINLNLPDIYEPPATQQLSYVGINKL